MSKRETYSDAFSGNADEELMAIIGENCNNENSNRLKRILIRIIKNELTEKQQQVVLMYYFQNMNTTEISGKINITPQAVSALLIRAKSRIFRILKYYFN